MKLTGYLIVSAALIPASTVLGGWVFQTLWGWFVVEEFDLPALGLAEAVGLVTLIRFATYTYVRQDNNGKSYGELLAEGVGASIVLYGMALLVGLIAHGFIA